MGRNKLFNRLKQNNNNNVDVGDNIIIENVELKVGFHPKINQAKFVYDKEFKSQHPIMSTLLGYIEVITSLRFVLIATEYSDEQQMWYQIYVHPKFTRRFYQSIYERVVDQIKIEGEQIIKEKVKQRESEEFDRKVAFIIFILACVLGVFAFILGYFKNQKFSR